IGIHAKTVGIGDAVDTQGIVVETAVGTYRSPTAGGTHRGEGSESQRIAVGLVDSWVDPVCMVVVVVVAAIGHHHVEFIGSADISTKTLPCTLISPADESAVRFGFAHIHLS